MGRYIINTTEAQDEGILYAYQQSLNPPTLPPAVVGRTVETQAEFFQRQVDARVSNPMDFEYRRVLNDSIIQSLLTIPEADRPAARVQITAIVESYGGTVLPKP